jgi:ASC-1-like (ASCH) protein
MKKTNKQYKEEIIDAGRKAVEELIRVAKERIITGDEDDLSADRLKNAAATKKLAVFDAFEILTKIELEKNNIEAEVSGKASSKQGFAERRSK